jgi:Cu/Ag efflux pump CusA
MAAGREVEQPMALVILGGVVTSTWPNLLVLPTLMGRCASCYSRSACGLRHA